MTIGLTYTGSEAKHANYANWIKAKDAIEVIELSDRLNNLDALASCDGVVLSGGIDISPQYYGGSEGYAHAPEPFHKERDAFEFAVFAATQERGIPVLGVCRGMQLINCYYGGTLLQDLQEKNSVHKITDQLDKVHGITVLPGTLLYQALGQLHCTVNSAHHQAIDRIGEGLKIAAVSEDGIAEAMERTQPEGKPYLLSVQWHPERLFRFGLQDTNVSKGIRAQFLASLQNK